MHFQQINYYLSRDNFLARIPRDNWYRRGWGLRRSITIFQSEAEGASCSFVRSTPMTPAKCLRLFVNGESIYCDRTTAIINHSTGQPYLCTDVSPLSEHGIVNPLTAESIMYTWVHMCMEEVCRGEIVYRRGRREEERHKKGTQKKNLTTPLPFSRQAI